MSFNFDAAVSAPFRMQPGLRRLAPGTPQLTPTAAPQRGHARHLREKLAVFGAFADQSLLARPGFDARSAITALAAHAAAEQPEAAAFDGQRLQAHWLGWSVDFEGRVQDHGGGWPEIGPLLQQLAPEWRLPALLSLAFAEDFAVVDGHDGHIPWLAVALPSGWAPEEKVGRHFAEVHAPVADNKLVVNAASHLTKLVTGTEARERFVWTISAHPRLHAHPRRVDPLRWPAELEPDALAAAAWWRTERQSFIPVPGQRQAVFTIGVQLQRLADAITTPQEAARVHEALASMSDAVLAYRGLADARGRLLAWLGRRAAA